MLTTVVMMSVVVAITNSFEYASDLSNATHLSHISGSRVVVNDALLTIGSLMSLTLLVYARNPISLLLSASAVALTFAGLIMTQARGAWLAFMLGAFVLVLLVRTPERVKILTIGTIISVLILGIGYILIGPFLNVIIEGIAERFSTNCYGIYARSVSREPIPGDSSRARENYNESPDRIWAWRILRVLRYRSSVNGHRFVRA